MAWDSKVVSWDFTHGTAAARNGGEPRFSDCSIDPKLGAFGEFIQSKAPKPSNSLPPPSSAPVKRPRPVGSEPAQSAACMVEGCKADLSKCRDYHRRHKVCEAHSKTPVAIVAGQGQRFCQQCSRFHLLVEFDEVKRSCRKRLDAHNMRRRKPQPETLDSGSFFASCQGLLHQEYSKIFNTSIAEPKKPVQLAGSNLRGNKEGKTFPFHPNGNPAMSGSSSSAKMIFSASDSALSLLSSPTPAALLGQMVTVSQPSVTEVAFGSHCSSGAGGVSFNSFSCSSVGTHHAELVRQLHNVVAGECSPEETMQHNSYSWY